MEYNQVTVTPWEEDMYFVGLSVSLMILTTWAPFLNNFTLSRTKRSLRRLWYLQIMRITSAVMWYLQIAFETDHYGVVIIYIYTWKTSFGILSHLFSVFWGIKRLYTVPIVQKWFLPSNRTTSPMPISEPELIMSHDYNIQIKIWNYNFLCI